MSESEDTQSHGSEDWHGGAYTEIKIVVFGSEESYKAAFIADYVESELGYNWSIDPTEDIFRKFVVIGSEGFAIKVQTDVGQEQLWGGFHETLKQAQGFIFLYKVNAKETFDVFNSEREKLVRYRQQDTLPIMIVGLVDFDTESSRQVSFEEGSKLAKAFNCSFTEYSPKSGKIDTIFINMVKLIQSFEAGQFAKKLSLPRTGSHASSITEVEIMLIGDILTGKSALIRKAMTGEFQAKYVSTTETSSHKMTIVLDQEAYLIKLIDTPGLHFIDTCTREMLSSVQGFILVYSVTSQNSFWELEKYRKKILSLRMEQNIPFLIVGSKSGIF